MAFFFGDGFDLYAAASDVSAGYWTSANLAGTAFVAGRFSGSQAISTGTASSQPLLVKASGSNDALHHLVIAYQQTQALGGSGNGICLQLQDGGAAQCSINFRSDGVITFTSGVATGTLLGTYNGGVAAANTWYAFEFEVFISATAGYINVRKNGNASNDFTSATNLNTRAGSANNYANQLTVGMSGAVNSQVLDDLLWRSDPATVAWVGDIRCYTRMPASDVSKVWTPNSGTTNYSRVNEAQEDGTTSYVYDGNVGDADFYSVAALAGNPASVVGVTTRGFFEKSDSGVRSGAVQLKSGATTVASASTAIGTSWGWLYRTDTTDPATGSAWTATGVNNAQIGPTVTG